MNKKSKDANDNAWANSHTLEKNNQSNNQSQTKKSATDNEWTSTNKN